MASKFTRYTAVGFILVGSLLGAVPASAIGLSGTAGVGGSAGIGGSTGKGSASGSVGNALNIGGAVNTDQSVVDTVNDKKRSTGAMIDTGAGARIDNSAGVQIGNPAPQIGVTQDIQGGSNARVGTTGDTHINGTVPLRSDIDANLRSDSAVNADGSVPANINGTVNQKAGVSAAPRVVRVH